MSGTYRICVKYLLSILRRWFCCCWSVVWCASHWLWGFCVCLCFVVQYFVSFLVLQSSYRGRESWLLCFILSNESLVTANVLWHFLIVPWVGLHCVIVVFPDHTHFLNIYCKFQNFARISFSWISMKDIFAMFKICNQGMISSISK